MNSAASSFTNCVNLAHFHHYHFANAEGHVVLSKQFFNAFGVAHHNPRDGGVGGFRDAHCHHVGAVFVEHLHDVEHRSHFVRQKNGELLHQRSSHLRSCFRKST